MYVLGRIGMASSWGRAPFLSASDHHRTPGSFSFLVIPEVYSERRQYVPSTLVRIIGSALLELFGLPTSAVHMPWLRRIRGKLGGGYRHSITLVCNTFPAPAAKESQLRKLARSASAVLDARRTHDKTNLSDLYSEDLMTSDFRAALRTLDCAVDRHYRKKPFLSDRERFERLLTLCTHSVDPAFSESKPKSRSKWDLRDPNPEDSDLRGGER